MKHFIMKYNKYLGMGLILLIVLGSFYSLRPNHRTRAIVMQYPFILESVKVVSLSTYRADTAETDSTPLITASGFKLDSLNPKKHRVIAISRDLKELFSFGDKVKLTNAGKFDGIWIIHDVMNKRYKNKIDILINQSDRQMSLKGVVISKI
jgi:3D (Asp-Asp-Asp) domain-containing protein